jgi:hypothetical protein
MRFGLAVASCVAVLVVGCNAAKAQGSSILSELESTQDNALIGEIQARNPGSLCALVASDGHPLLMSFGRRAVVDINARPTVLTYQPSIGGHEASFTGRAVRVSGDLARQEVTDLSKTISHDVTVEVHAGGRTERLKAAWTCQKSLMTVRVAHCDQPRPDSKSAPLQWRKWAESCH